MTIVKRFYSIYANYITVIGVIILISYKPFWKTLEEKSISTYTLINKFGISSATIDRMKKGKGISTMKINDFCEILDCTVSDIIEYEKN